MHQPVDNATPLFGLDVWDGYGVVDFATVREKTKFKDFAIVRLSMASAGVDKHGVANVHAARNAGIPLVGAYMVPAPNPLASTPKAEVALFLRQLEAAGGLDFVVVDFELPSAAKVLANPTLRRNCALHLREVVQRLQDALCIVPTIYSTPSYIDAYAGLLDDLVGCPLWLAHYLFAKRDYDPIGREPRTPKPWSGLPEIWQYAGDGTGSLPGLPVGLQGVDRNVALGFASVDDLRVAMCGTA